jgi:hypothetical protein
MFISVCMYVSGEEAACVNVHCMCTSYVYNIHVYAYECVSLCVLRTLWYDAAPSSHHA